LRWNGVDVVVDEAVIYLCGGDAVTGQERVAMNPGYTLAGTGDDVMERGQGCVN
jgi:hypothetical protein